MNTLPTDACLIDVKVSSDFIASGLTELLVNQQTLNASIMLSTFCCKMTDELAASFLFISLSRTGTQNSKSLHSGCYCHNYKDKNIQEKATVDNMLNYI